MSRFDRRDFLKFSAGAAAVASMPCWLADLTYGYPNQAQGSDRLRLGAIGVGGRGSGIMHDAIRYADLVAVCDVDRNHAEKARQDTGGKAEVYSDYRKLLERKDIDVVTIGTPDHWHTGICLAALKAGKDVYCEKPLTLTIEEGQLLVDAVRETGQVLQVGTQQRSEMGLVFLRAVATVRSGRLGKLKQVTVSLPLSTSEGGPFDPKPVPEHLNWDFWLGQAPEVPYCPERCHFQFRWWFEYSGGIMTDWGAHHVDIAHWAMDCEQSGPLSADGSKTVLPNIAGGYNTPKRPIVDMIYPGDVHVQITTGNEGVLFEGENGRIYVNRGRVTGKPIEEQDADQGLKDKIVEQMNKLYTSGKPGSHMGNFFECVKSRKQPISDVVSQHRSVSACHVANISCRLGRKLTWDPAKERFVGDDEANTYVGRPQREPYQIIA
jgi:predicted dehydrogenase